MAEKLINKSIRVTLKDDRIVYGILTSFDKDANMIIQDATVQLPKEFVSPINQYIQTAFKHGTLIDQYIKLPSEIRDDEEKFQQFQNEFWLDKNYQGQVLVPGKQIQKVEIQI